MTTAEYTPSLEDVYDSANRIADQQLFGARIVSYDRGFGPTTLVVLEVDASAGEAALYFNPGNEWTLSAAPMADFQEMEQRL
jgi:hypothetical protein